MFDDTRSSVSHIYSRFECWHHLIQTGHGDNRPNTPSLTPGGFENWVRVLIKAYPNTEYERLQKALELFQIRDKGGLPVTINRSLFPELSDSKIREDLKRSIADNTPTAHNDSYSRNGPSPNISSGAIWQSLNVPLSSTLPANPPRYNPLTKKHPSHSSHSLPQPSYIRPP